MLKYHTFWPRLWAGIVDGLVFMPITLLDGYLSAPERGAPVLVAWGVLTYTAYWLYSVLLHARFGQTIGKMVTGVRVLDVSEARIPTLRQAFIRDIGYISLNTLSLAYLIFLVVSGQYVSGAEGTTLPGQILTWASFGWFLIELISMATNDKRRALHDFIAGTVVVRNEPRPK
jgi:uncharacterized RDD family membrane protein YckC